MGKKHVVHAFGIGHRVTGIFAFVANHIDGNTSRTPRYKRKANRSQGFGIGIGTEEGAGEGGSGCAGKGRGG